MNLRSHVSTCRTVSRGCPQGSSLGPLLWNIFQNDLSFCVTTNLSMYADDHQIYHIGSDKSSVSSKLKHSARAATKWYDSHLLAGNLKKYQTMNIGYSQAIHSAAPALHVNNKVLCRYCSYLYLLHIAIRYRVNKALADANNQPKCV